MKSIQVALAQNPYEIEIAAGNIDRLGEKCRALGLGAKVMLVSNPTVFGYYGQRAIASLEQAGFQAEIAPCILEDGEAYKTRESVVKIQDLALEQGLERSSTMVA